METCTPLEQLHFPNLLFWEFALRRILTFIYCRSHSVVWSLSWKVFSCSAGQGIPHFYGTQRFITMFTKACHWLPLWAQCI
jgi:hypothetical protein